MLVQTVQKSHRSTVYIKKQKKIMLQILLFNLICEFAIICHRKSLVTNELVEIICFFLWIERYSCTYVIKLRNCLKVKLTGEID